MSLKQFTCVPVVIGIMVFYCLVLLRVKLTLHKQAVDAIDNGISQYNTTQLPRFVNNTSLTSRVERLNPDWICPNQSVAEEDESFQQAMKVAGNEFLEVLLFCILQSLVIFNDFWQDIILTTEHIFPSVSIFMLNHGCQLDRLS